ncbi:glycoside hydrolase [Microthyrium microscopicum]|uniref:Alpha-galactosidase n=1 Tax=Microthyrium microscopicum TaxID=703497 RepID=A0A6A6UFI3_9PEZI|nr:glycoside hydrolase [Microthyrium microscopicum]
MRIAAVIAAGTGLTIAYAPGATSYNGLNLTPQMGWNTWNAFQCNVNETLLLNTAKSLVSLGLKELGYDYLILDDCWSTGRNDSGYLVEDTVKFPNGMKSLISQVHSYGLKFGIYSSAGLYTCGRYPGSLGYEQKDADLWASWGVDYLKYDNCYNQGQSGTPKLSFDRYNVMSKALNATGRPILYSMCNWGQDNPFDWAYTIANSYRMSGDIYDSFSRPDPRCPCDEAIGCSFAGYHCSVLKILNMMASIGQRTQSGSFNDMDMLEVGNAGMTDSEYVTHFSMWAFMSSPLLIGTNLLSLSPGNLAILSNPAVIALNQDPSAGAAVRKWRYPVADTDEYGIGEIALWTRTMDNGDSVVALVNAGNASRSMNATAKDLFIDQGTSGTYTVAAELSEEFDIYDLWANRMGEAEAGQILNGTAEVVAMNSTTRYNSTRVSYADGLKANATALFGKKIGRLSAGGTLTATVDRRSLGLFRLRKVEGNKLRKRDEL